MIPHRKYLEMALKLAEKGRHTVSPNPMVGSLVVKRGKIIGRGFHVRAGEDHAEVIALKQAGKRAKNSTLYVTLEPCSHWGRTPPCTEAIVKSGVSEVVIGMKDPNPLVNGFGILKSRGIKTRMGVLEEEARRMNEIYIKYIKTKKPFVILKVAASLDGKIATSTGNSKYITSKESRKYVHQLRSNVDAVLIGINTLIADNPKLDARLVKGKDPIKIIVDSTLKIPLKGNIMKSPEKLIIATTSKAPKNKIKAIQNKGAKIIIAPSKAGLVDLDFLMRELGKHEITSILIEGGNRVNSSALKEKIVDKILVFTAPRLIGKGLDAFGDLGIKKLDNTINIREMSTRKIGNDILVEGYL
ncbi:MAG TPA: bifunctional diaminohydroxyphosphoribosylaminopyrimidine deaminase/5-amino-6-(5-phosphoribosylamino)uracil reductase RibD [Candidatus Nanoarchaeia archaeon]|nr:bifunctional diaminohydroxyphosphoribosylaminopyrimidine deaminase/5-amino-6-(5-phosphoribosylamino)uracil reductase RibD [Candidatus Nanoarchaeia archaeon]